MGLKANLNFELGQPFRPFQQLMGVLPDRSKKHVPLPYHDLMTNPDSPIIDFYPRDFVLDMNGKKTDWEAVVKIPFIDEKRLLTAMATKDKQLTDDERSRNEFGVSLKFAYAKDVDFIYPSSLVGVFPDIERCHCVVNTFELPTMDGLEFHIGLMEGAKLGEAALAGFPSLKTLPHSGALGHHGVTVFQQESRQESMVVTLLDTELRSTLQAAKERLGKKVHIGYPFLNEAKVVRVSDELFDYFPAEDGQSAIMTVPHSPQDVTKWRRKADEIERHYSRRYGIVIGDVESIVHVEMLKGLKILDDGAISKEYAEIQGVDTDYATQVIVDEVISEDQRFLEKAAQPIEEEFPNNFRGFYLGEGCYGRPMVVIGHRDNKVDIRVKVGRKDQEWGLGITKEAERLNPYIPSYTVARMLNLNPLVLSKITASFKVAVDSQRINLGLNLKFESKKLKVLGYSRRNASGWEFSQKAIDLLQQYMIRFPEFIAGIQRNPQGDIYHPEDFYPAEVAKTKVKEIQGWLKSIEAKNFEQVPLDAEQLDSMSVQKIEEASKFKHQEDLKYAAAPREEGAPDPSLKNIFGAPRVALLKPGDAEHRLGNQKFSLGDRVVYVPKAGKVPIACKGTVVGLTRTSRTLYLDIVWSEEVMSATTLGDRCSPHFGSTLPAWCVLNLTNEQLVVETRATIEQRQSMSTQQSTTPRGGRGSRYGVPVGPGGRGQYIDATEPPPRLNGSWRDAAAGSPRSSERGSPRTRGSGRARAASIGSRGGPSHPQTQSSQPQPQPILNDPAIQAYSNMGQIYGSWRGRGGPGSTPIPIVNGQVQSGMSNAWAGNLPLRSNGNYTGTNAANGQTNANQTSSNSTDNTAQNQPAPMPIYGNVPPPPSLDATNNRGGAGGRGPRRGATTGGYRSPRGARNGETRGGGPRGGHVRGGGGARAANEENARPNASAEAQPNVQSNGNDNGVVAQGGEGNAGQGRGEGTAPRRVSHRARRRRNAAAAAREGAGIGRGNSGAVEGNSGGDAGAVAAAGN